MRGTAAIQRSGVPDGPFGGRQSEGNAMTRTAEEPGKIALSPNPYEECRVVLMAFLISPGARWMTGSARRMDGGDVSRSERSSGLR